MLENLAKTKMLRGEPAFGISASVGSPVVAEMLAFSGIDFVLVDSQHGSFAPESAGQALMAVSHSPATPIARVARNDYTMIGRLLDEGALGIVVPMVENANDARAAAHACRFPPDAGRSWGWGRAGSYGGDYTSWINREIFLAVQIESIHAVENAEAIMGTDGVDGCWIGPSDLAASMGISPSESAGNPEHERAVASVLEVCHKTGKIPGFAAWTPEEAVARAKQGFQFLTCGSDVGYIEAGATRDVSIVDS